VNTSEKQRRRKIHLGIDVATLELWAIEVTDNATGDAPMLPFLLDQIPAEEVVASVSDDGAYNTKGCHEAIAQRGAQALIPTRKNAKPWASVPVLKRAMPSWQPPAGLAESSGRSGMDIIGTALSKPKCCLNLLGERIVAGDFDRQVAELQVRAAIPNRFTRFDTPKRWW
jgi:hypothetical protein